MSASVRNRVANGFAHHDGGDDHHTSKSTSPTSNNHNHLHPNHIANGTSRAASPVQRILTGSQKEEIASLVLWRRPLPTLLYALYNLWELLQRLSRWIWNHSGLCLAATLLVSVFCLALQIPGAHQPYVQYHYKLLAWCLYWCGLGILSSVGLGTGLHTFILYLGPHIARVTLAAYECNTLNFPEPPYPDEILCPSEPGTETITVWSIMSKVRLEAFMWGAGTALGELPPYFLSRASRLAGDGNQDDELLEELEDLVPELDDAQPDGDSNSNSGVAHSNRRRSSLGHTMKSKMVQLMKRLGFFGILACASIPNPLFDLAGMICGYSLISFWTFFGATLLGKAVIKMHIQKLVVIIVFNEAYVDRVLEFSGNIPYVGQYIHDPLRDYLQLQKKSLHGGSVQTKGASWISFAFEMFVALMVTYFLVSIVNSMAQSQLKKQYQKQLEEKSSSTVAKESLEKAQKTD